ncbi:MAG: PAS domain-containing protein [Pseudomonadota bacterium]|nr:PAS domain-containing protein [Pseudomonadota bacterium]
MAQRIRAFDWAATPLGDASSWPPQLLTLVDLMLASPQPMFLAWGPERIWLYNDAMVQIMGEKHPTALGRPGLQVWAEARAVLEPLFARVYAGEAVHMQGFRIGLDRSGRLEDAVFDFSYTPLRDADGGVTALFGICTETTEWVRARERELESIARQRRQFQQAPNFVVAMSGPLHVVDFVNDKHRELFGSAGWIGKPIREAFPSLAGQGFYELLDQVYASGEAYQARRAQVHFERVPGAPECRYLDFVYAPTLDENARVVGVFCDGFDVTDVVHAELALRSGDLRQRALVELGERFRDAEDPAEISYAAAEVLGRTLNVSRAGYGTVDKKNETITIERDWNAPGIASLAGVLHFRDYGSYIEDLKQGSTVVVSDADADPRTAATAASLKAIAAASFVNMPVTEHAGLVALLYLNHAQPRVWRSEELALIREVAERTRTTVERRRAEEELRALAASLEQQVLERTEERDRVWRNSPDLLVVIGADGIFRDVNPAWTTILGHPASEVVGRSYLEFIWAEDAALTQGGLEDAVKRRDLTNFENRYARIDGSPRWISWHTAAEGDLVLAYGRDITDQKKAQQELAIAHEALRQSQKMEAVGQLTGGLAHDFNNLLAAISGSLELLTKRVTEGRLAGIDRFVSTAQGAARRAAALTHRLLAFSRQQTLDPRPTDVNRLIGGMEDLIRRSTGPNVAVEVVGAVGLWLTKVDPPQLENALLNLCINARDAMAPGGGRLTIETANRWLDDRAALERDLAPGQYISICITDTGVGMAPEVVARAFDPFFTTKPLGEGTGLGLSMVYGFVRQSGGQVRVSSEVGRGTTMCLYLPRFNGAALPESQAIEAADGTRESAGETVLVIDDEPSIRMLIVEVLDDAGFVTMQAGDGAKGLRILQSNARVDLMITDVGLPGGMNGRQVADAARRLRPALKVLFITGFAETAVVGNGHLEQGMQVLTKPFEMSTLATKVRDLIER